MDFDALTLVVAIGNALDVVEAVKLLLWDGWVEEYDEVVNDVSFVR